MNLPALTLPQFHRRDDLGVDLGTLIDPGSWAEVLTNPASPLYFPSTIEEYDSLVHAADVAGNDLHGEARDICQFVERGTFTHIFSVGSGAAKLEYSIHRMLPGVKITLTEYSEAAVSRLRQVFHGVEQITDRG